MANFIRYLLSFSFKFLCWLLITGSLSRSNLILGFIFCALLPPGSYRQLKIQPILPEIFRSLSLPYLMIKESFQLMMIERSVDQFVVEKSSKYAAQGSNFSAFMNLFRITFTPMSLVTKRLSSSQWRIHLVGDSGSSRLQQTNPGLNQEVGS